MTINIIQRSPEWHAARLGSLGASCVHEIVARTKTEWSASRKKRRAALVLERITGRAQDTYINAAMQNGIDTEPEARAYYAFTQDCDVVEVGLVRHPTIASTHASPDGLIGDHGLVEIKCPESHTHLATVEGEPIADKYVVQMQWQMACTGRQWCDFLSYSSAFPAHLRAVIKRVPRDDKRIHDLESAVLAFLAEVDAAVKRLAQVAA
jgi:putative phage-type endonuclease